MHEAITAQLAPAGPRPDPKPSARQVVETMTGVGSGGSMPSPLNVQPPSPAPGKACTCQESREKLGGPPVKSARRVPWLLNRVVSRPSHLDLEVARAEMTVPAGLAVRLEAGTKGRACRNSATVGSIPCKKQKTIYNLRSTI